MRFHFHIIDHDTRMEDVEGKQMADLEAAREEAIAGAREIMSNRISTGTRSALWKFEIVDDAGSVVLNVPFTDAMD